MEALPTVISSNISNIVMLLIALVISAVIAYLIRRAPEQWGMSRPLTFKSYIPALLPIAVFVVMVIKEKSDGISYPTGIGIYHDVVLVKGVSIIYQERADDGVEIPIETDKMILYNKKDGSILKQFTNFTMGYIRADKLLGREMNYQVIDISSGEVQAVFTEDEIRDKATTAGNEKILQLDFRSGQPGFSVRTVKDHHYRYDPITNQIDPQDCVYPFTDNNRREAFSLADHDLFQPEVLGITGMGTTVVLSYDDLEKKNFMLHAFSKSGERLWSKYDYQISDQLRDVNFFSSRLQFNTAIDDNVLYFVTDSELIAISLDAGNLKWITDL
jgi:hypothetical protein